MVDSDEIRLTSTEYPRMEPKRHHCRICGGLMTTVGAVCAPCVGKRYLIDALEQQREQLAVHPQHAWETALDRGHKLHLVLVANRRLAWCGQTLVQAPSKRKRSRAPFPQELCPNCRQVYEGLVPVRGGG